MTSPQRPDAVNGMELTSGTDARAAAVDHSTSLNRRTAVPDEYREFCAIAEADAKRLLDSLEFAAGDPEAADALAARLIERLNNDPHAMLFADRLLGSVDLLVNLQRAGGAE